MRKPYGTPPTLLPPWSSMRSTPPPFAQDVWWLSMGLVGFLQTYWVTGSSIHRWIAVEKRNLTIQHLDSCGASSIFEISLMLHIHWCILFLCPGSYGRQNQHLLANSLEVRRWVILYLIIDNVVVLFLMLLTLHHLDFCLTYYR